MEQYIKKSDIVAEIEKLQLCTMDEHTNFYSAEAYGEYNALSKLENFLDTLEVKEINNVWNNASDFSKAEAGRSILLIEDNGRTELLKSPSAERLFYFRTTNLKMWAYVDELLSITTHFDVKEVDFGTEVYKYIDEHFNMYDDGNQTLQTKDKKSLIGRVDAENIAKHFYELGLKADKEEKDAQSKDMIEALRLEYEKGRADVIADTLSWLANVWPQYCSNPNIIDAYKEGVVKD